MNVLLTLLLAVQMLSALAMIGLILIQHGKGADMGAAFGSGGSGSLFGASGSANFLSRTTAVLRDVFFVMYACCWPILAMCALCQRERAGARGGHCTRTCACDARRARPDSRQHACGCRRGSSGTRYASFRRRTNPGEVSQRDTLKIVCFHPGKGLFSG